MLNQPTPPQQLRQQQLPHPRPGAPSPANKFVQHANPQTKQFVPTPYTPNEYDEIQSKLNKVLGPEYVSYRPSGGGQKVQYIEGWKALNLANEIFGFNGWNSEIITCNIDYLDTHGNSGKFSLGLSVVVRVTLRDGTFHEDIGYGYVDNCKSKAMAFEKCKKEALTDGVKRCLRCFGNVLGNCLYDKTIVAQMNKMKQPPIQYEPENYHRDPLLVERDRKKRIIDEKFEQIRRSEEEAAKGEQDLEEEQMRIKYNVAAAAAQPQHQHQPNLQQNNAVPTNVQHQQNVQRQAPVQSPAQHQPHPQQLQQPHQPHQPHQLTRVNGQNQSNGHNAQRPNTTMQPTRQLQEINQRVHAPVRVPDTPSLNQRQPNLQHQQHQLHPSLQANQPQRAGEQSSRQARPVVHHVDPAPQLIVDPSTFVTPKLPHKNSDYFPTSKEADELDDSFLFSDDMLDGASQHGLHTSPRQQKQQLMPKPSGTNVEPNNGTIQSNSEGQQEPTNANQQEMTPLPENAIDGFVAARSANLLQDASTDPKNIPKFDATFISPNIRRSVDPTKSVKTKKNDSPSPLGVNTNNHMINKPFHNPLHLNMGRRIGMPPQPRQTKRPQLENSSPPPTAAAAAAAAAPHVQQEQQQQVAPNIIYPPPASVVAHAQANAPSASQ